MPVADSIDACCLKATDAASNRWLMKSAGWTPENGEIGAVRGEVETRDDVELVEIRARAGIGIWPFFRDMALPTPTI